MSSIILGISAFYHDSAAAIIRDGVIVAAAQEERFTRKKHDPRFPRNAIDYCLSEAFCDASELTAIAFYDDTRLTLDRVIKSALQRAPRTEDQWVQAAQSILGQKAFLRDMLRDTLGVDVPLLVTEHHASHAASAFYPSPFEDAAILTVDGVGEWATTTLGVGEKERVRILEEIHYPDSLGLLYSAFTYYCGFKVNSGEYKLMGLAPYGRPIYADLIREKLIDVKPDGSFKLNPDYFGFVESLVMTNSSFEELFGGPPRAPESRISQREMDLAASIQEVTEEVMVLLAMHLREKTGMSNLVLAGGVALNCVANGRLLREKIFDNIWIQPAAGDAGGAVGAALLAAHHTFGEKRVLRADGRDTQAGSYLGPAFSSAEVRAFLDRGNIPYECVTADQRARVVAEALAAGKIVGYAVGRMEFGPRALGARSILGDPRNPDTQVNMNLKIKFRESFRPFAPSVLAERVADYFEMDTESPYMLLVAPVVEQRRLPFDRFGTEWGSSDDLLPIVRISRSDVPAITHVDYSARIQTVHREDKPDYYEVIREFDKLTGYPVIVNTSFNVRGEPIVCTPADAYRCFMRTNIDVLVLEDCILHKSAQPAPVEDESWKEEFELD
jgi:carbamoyltransferase